VSRAAWAPLAEELARWDAAGMAATFWWRDDDAAAPGPALDRLLDMGGRYGVPLALAVVPEPAGTPLADRLAREPLTTVLQHGWAHRNWAPDGEKRQELGPHRPVAAVCADIGRGHERIAALFGDRALPVLVPPWNRIAPAVVEQLPTLGISGLSTFGPRPARLAARVAACSVLAVNTHVDMIDWRNRSAAAPEVVAAQAVAHLTARRTGRADPDEPTGFLTHHLVHGEAAWDLCARVLDFSMACKAVRWLDPRTVFEVRG